MERPIHRVVDLVDAESQQIFNMEVEEARSLLTGSQPDRVAAIEGSFASAGP